MRDVSELNGRATLYGPNTDKLHHLAFVLGSAESIAPHHLHTSLSCVGKLESTCMLARLSASLSLPAVFDLFAPEPTYRRLSRHHSPL